MRFAVEQIVVEKESNEDADDESGGCGDESFPYSPRGIVVSTSRRSPYIPYAARIVSLE
jgi:hypothetical protein